MIRVGVVANVFELQDRQYHDLDYREGMTLQEIGAVYFGAAVCVPYLNGKMGRDLEVEVSDGDFVHLIGCPSDPVTIMAAVWSIVQLVAAILIVAWIIKELYPEFDQSATDRDPYLGFSNTYRPEGDAIPVVYGTVRTAHPCVNQSVLGTIFQLDNPVLGNVETLNSLYVISHGPIDGLGLLRREISDTSDGGGAFSGENAQLQVNGIDARHFTGVYEWRTGTGSQTPIIGNLGQIRYTDPGVIYNLNHQPADGSDAIPEETHVGQVLYANRIKDADTTQYVRQFLSTKCDRAVVQFLFPMGLWHMDNDSGNFGDESRIVQIQYWVTDSSGTAIPDKVTVLEAHTITSDQPNAISLDWPTSMVNPTSISGGGGARGYAALSSVTPARLLMDGSGTDGADLDLLHPGNASNVTTTAVGSYPYSTTDEQLLFSFAAWVRVPSWETLSISDPPVQWLFHWSREATQGAVWNQAAAGGTSPIAENLYAPPHVNDPDESFGCAACIAIDPSNISGNTGPDANDPWVVLMVYTWDGNEGWDEAGNPYTGKGYMSRFISKRLGRASDFADWNHIGFTWDQRDWDKNGAAGTSSTGGVATVKAYANGREEPINLDVAGANYPSLSFPGNDTGYLYGVKPTSGPYAGMVHVPLKFYNDDKTTLRIGGWDNIGATGTQPFQRTQVDIAEYAFMSTILPESWYQGMVNSPDNFGNNPTASVTLILSDGVLAPHARLLCPMHSGDVVATDFYKNYAVPDATTQAGGCLEIEDTAATVKADSGPTYFSQTAVGEGGYYIMEVFVSSPTLDGGTGPGENRQNSISIESITTFLTDEYAYPGVAVISTSLQGTDQISSTNPDLTTVVHGKKVNVWDGESVESPTFRFKWSNNPAWISLDVLTNRTFGLGGIFSPDGTYSMMHLPAFFDWASFCDEGVPDAYGSLPFFGMRTGTPQYYSLTLYFGQVDTAGTSVQTMPRNWAVGNYMSITEIAVADIGSEWVTKDDVVGGLNNASNLLEITNIEFKNSGGTPFHGWGAWFQVTFTRNRDTWLEGTDPMLSPYPDGVFADQFEQAISLGSAGQYEHRARYNGVLGKKNADAWDELTGIFQNGRAIPMKIGRKVMPVWDAPREPVALVGQGNIKEGSFELSYSDPKVLPNSIEMEILDEDRNWQGQTILVDYTGIQGTTEFQQLHKEHISLPGCTSRSQATREATYRLNKYALSRLIAKFEVGPDSIHLLPGDRVQVSHDVPEYGSSGRLPVAMEILNTWPTAESIFDSWTQQGGNCTISDRALLEEIAHADQVPPLVNYLDGSVLAYAVPTSTATNEGQVTAGSALDPAYERTPNWATQFVAVGDGLYPTPMYSGSVPLAPLDRIDNLAKTVNFSVYCKEPPAAEAGGAAASVALIIYRFCNDSGYVKATHGALFTWSATGVLEFDSYFGDGAGTTPFGLTAWVLDPADPQLPYNWHRIAVKYENNANNGPGSAAVGDYLQARLIFNWAGDGSFTFANLPTFYNVADGGRGNQLLQAGDPSNLDLQDDLGTPYWQGDYCNATVPTAGRKIVNESDVAPPFYPEDKNLGTGTAGDRGYVIFFDHDTGVTTTPFFMTQGVAVNGFTGASPLAVSRINQAFCFTGYFKHYFTGEAFSCIINIRCGVTKSGEAYTSDGGQVELIWDGVNYSLTDTPVGGTITLASQIQDRVRLNSTTDDASWVRVNIQVQNSSNFNDIGFQVGSNSLSGGGARFYGWGFRLHSRGGTGAGTGATSNPYPHHGTRLWGPYYDPTYVDPASAGEPPTFSSGCQIQLDRDVTVTTATPAELYLRSSFERDENLNTDVTEVLQMAYNELPTVPGATLIKAARSWLSFSMPQKMYPRTGDIYSFGNSGSSTEDFIVVDIRTNPDSLIRKIECIEYNEAIYDDTSFADIVDETNGGGGGAGGGGVGSGTYGGGGQWDVTYGGPGFDSITLSGRPAPYRASDGYLVPSWKLWWKDTARIKKMPYKEVRLWAQKAPSGSYQYIATIPAGVHNYRYDDLNVSSGDGYFFYIQPVGFTGTCLPVDRCPKVLVPGSVYGPLAEVPIVTVATHGYNNVVNATSGNTSRLAAIEGRIGGWVISTPAWIVDPNVGRFITEAVLAVPTDSAGFTQGILYARGKTLGGAYGKLATVTGTEEFVDVLSSRQLIAENDYAAAVDGTIDVNLYVTSDILHWNAASSSLGPVYYRCEELDSTTPRRMVVNAVIQGYQVRHETLADLAFALGSSTGRNWSLEGPMKDDGGNASVEIEWRWTSGGTITSVEWRRFEAGEVYARKVQFRLKWTRKHVGDNVKLARFTQICNDVPATTQVDGGTF